MPDNAKATADYMPAPTGQKQSPERSINNVAQATTYFNENISRNPLKLINMGDVAVEQIDWLWYPYIPFGKITVIQGDPGNGKTTMILAIAAAVTKGEPLPECETIITPATVIFQTAEDGLGDTVKPRLLQAGADCNRVIVIDESEKELSLRDNRIEEALITTGAKLFILDPLQAYLGADVDMHRANEVRPVLKRISLLAEKTGCAVVVVGHLNKGTSQSQYRGLGSIDIQAAARSVLTIGRIKGNQYLRAFAQGKNNLAPEGQAIAFELNPDCGFKWVGAYPVTVDELLGGRADRETTAERAQTLLISELTGKSLTAKDMFDIASEHDISGITLKRAKSAAGVRSFKKNNQWFWTIDEPAEQEYQQSCIENMIPLPAPAESGGITGKTDDSDELKKQGYQQSHTENLIPLPSCESAGDADGKN